MIVTDTAVPESRLAFECSSMWASRKKIKLSWTQLKPVDHLQGPRPPLGGNRQWSGRGIRLEVAGPPDWDQAPNCPYVCDTVGSARVVVAHRGVLQVHG